MTKGINPSTITGTRAARWGSLPITHPDYVLKRIRIYPLASVGLIDVHARIYPIVAPALDWSWEDTMYLDRDMLVYACSFMALISDGLNPTGADTCKNLMENQYNNITNGLSNHPIAIEANSGVPNEWTVR
jgi:hypothetical protein